MISMEANFPYIPLSKKRVIAWREKVNTLAETMKKMDQKECPVTHRFAPGCYLREILIPEDTVIIGKIHATQHFNIILKGEALVITAEERKKVSAGETFVSDAGIQKLVYAYSDCVWQTVHVTDKTDLEEIEKEVIASSYDQLEVDSLMKKLGDMS